MAQSYEERLLSEMLSMADYALTLVDLGHVGWVHIVGVDKVPGGYSWTVTSRYMQDGAFVRQRRLGAPDGERWESIDMAQAAAAMAVECIVESRGGVVVAQ